MATVPVVPNGQQQVAAKPIMQQAASAVPSPSTALNPIQGAQDNTYVPPTGATPGAIPTGNTATQSTDGINWADGSHTVTGDFKDTYGAGTGTAITDVLQNLGTSTDAAVTATTNATNLAANNQYANIQAQQAAAGITPNSSAAALAAGDFYSQVNTNLQSTIANMENSEQNTLLNALTNEGSAHGSDTSGLDSLLSGISSIIPGVSSLANGINSTAASGTGTLSDILSAVGELG